MDCMVGGGRDQVKLFGLVCMSFGSTCMQALVSMLLIDRVTKL
jgi:hypothetical protein